MSFTEPPCMIVPFCVIGPVKAVARKQRPLHNLHSVVHLTKQLIVQLKQDLSSEVIFTLSFTLTPLLLYCFMYY